MGFGEFFLETKKGIGISLSGIKDNIKREDYANNAKLQAIFDLFDTDETKDGNLSISNKQGKNELKSIFEQIAAADENSDGVIDNIEADKFIQKFIPDSGITSKDLFIFLASLINTDKINTQNNNSPTKKSQTEEEVQSGVIDSLRADTDETLSILQQKNNGKISDMYDSMKEFFNSDTSSAKVMEAAVNQSQGAKYMEKAQKGELTYGEYIRENKARLKEMMKNRLYKKDKDGVDYIDKNRASLNMSRKDFEALMLATIERMTEDMDINEIKEKMRQLPLSTEAGDRFLMDKVKENAVVLYGRAKQAGCSTIDSSMKYISDTTRTALPSPDDDKLMTFEEVFYYEQGINYSKEACEAYLNDKNELNMKLGAYNKFLQFKTEADNILKEKDAEKALNKLIGLFENFYENPIEADLAFNNLQAIINNKKLPISLAQDENGNIKMSVETGSDDLLLSYVSDILSSESDIQADRLNKIFGGNAEEKISELQKKVEFEHEKAYGNDFSSTLGKMMIEDNQTFIQRYAGGASMIGMGLMLVGGVLCLTPAAPLGAGLATGGQVLAMGGMATESILGYTEAATREHGAMEGEYEELTKNLIMNAGGFIVGLGAGKAGNLAFQKIINKKLSDVLKINITQNNRAAALKQVFSDKELLFNFMKVGGAKISSDFLISYAGDLVMMGVLDTDDDWMSLLKSNLMGIMVGTTSELGDIAKLGKKGKTYEVLIKKEKGGKLSKQEAEALEKLRQDPDIQKAYNIRTGEPKKPGDVDVDNIKYRVAENTSELYNQINKLSGDIIPDNELNILFKNMDMSKESLEAYSNILAIIKEFGGNKDCFREIIEYMKQEQKNPTEVNTLIKNLVKAYLKPENLFSDSEIANILFKLKREDNIENINQLLQEFTNIYGKSHMASYILDIYPQYVEPSLALIKKYASDPELKDIVNPAKTGLGHHILLTVKNQDEMAQRIKQAQKLFNLGGDNRGTYGEAKRNILTVDDAEMFNKYLQRLNLIKNQTGEDKPFNSKQLLHMYDHILSLSDIEFENISKRNLWDKAYEWDIDNFAKLSNEEYARFKQRGLEVTSDNIKLVKLTDAEYKNYVDRNLASTRFGVDTDFYTKLSAEEWNLVEKYELKNGNTNTVRFLLDKGENYIKILQKRNLLEKSVNSYKDTDLINKFATMSDSEFKIVEDRKLTEYFPNRRQKYKDKICNVGFSLSEIDCLMQVNEKDWPRIEFLLTVQRGIRDIEKTHNWGDKKFENMVEPFDLDQVFELSNLSEDDFKFLKESGALNDLSMDSIRAFLDFQNFVGIDNIKDLSTADNRRLASLLVKHNEALFEKDFLDFISKKYEKSILPTNQPEYCATLSHTVREGVMEVNPITKEQQIRFENSLAEMGKKDSAFFKTDLEAENFKINMEYPRDKFMQDVMSALEGLNNAEKQRIMDYYGFEVYIKDGHLVMSGYPSVLKSAPELNSPQGKKVKELVERFTNNNKIEVKDNPELSKMLNDIFDAFPELKGMIGKVQHGMHDYTVDVHTLKVLQGVMSNPKFELLSPSDKKILTISTLMHDISKKEMEIDKQHPSNSATEAYQLLAKMDLSQEEKENIFAIIKHHDWLEKYNAAGISPEERTKIAQQLAYDLKDGNNFELASILAEADLKGVQRGGRFYDIYKTALQSGIQEISGIVRQVKASEIYIPQTKIPRASQLKVDGNIVEERVIKGYKVKVLHLRKGQDLSKVGFPPGTMSDDVQLLYHGCAHQGDGANSTGMELIKSFDDINSDAVLSHSLLSTYNPQVYAPYGIISYTPNSHIIAGTYCNVGSGYNRDKIVSNMVERFVYGESVSDREYFPSKMKEKLHLDNEQYIKLYDEISGMSMAELRQNKPDVAQVMDEIFYETERARQTATSTGFNGQHITEFLVRNIEKQAIGCPYGTKYLDDIPEFLLKDALESDIVIICND